MTPTDEPADFVSTPPLPPRNVADLADLFAKLEAAIRTEERAQAGTSHDQQEAESATWRVRLDLRVALAAALNPKEAV